jgi:hypothetical protein
LTAIDGGNVGGIDTLQVDGNVPGFLHGRHGRGLETPALDLVFDKGAERALRRAVLVEIGYRA